MLLEPWPPLLSISFLCTTFPVSVFVMYFLYFMSFCWALSLVCICNSLINYILPVFERLSSGTSALFVLYARPQIFGCCDNHERSCGSPRSKKYPSCRGWSGLLVLVHSSCGACRGFACWSNHFHSQHLHNGTHLLRAHFLSFVICSPLGLQLIHPKWRPQPANSSTSKMKYHRTSSLVGSLWVKAIGRRCVLI